MRFNTLRMFTVIVLFLVVIGGTWAETPLAPDGASSSWPWWVWSILLFVFCFILGVLAIVAGVGGGILYVPIVSAVFPFHIDFVRGAGLLVALTGAISAAPRLLESGMASLRLAIPMALAASVGSVVGAKIGFALSENVVEVALGAIILAVVGLMILAKGSEHPRVAGPSSSRLSIGGVYCDASQKIHWQAHRLSTGSVLFLLIGFMAGLFGLGAGWANVPALNLVLGAPLKVSVATSILIIAINGSAASWVYFNQGAVLPIIAAPSVAGMMLGTRLGARLLSRTRPRAIRQVVIAFLFLAGLRSLLLGLGVLT